MISEINCVISAYREDGIARAESLACRLSPLVRRVIVVVNEDGRVSESHRTTRSFLEIRRPNYGMNIGAWLRGIKFCDPGHPILYLQDECEPTSLEGPRHYTKLLNQRSVGMVGESLNPKWSYSWEQMSSSALNYLVKMSDGKAITRVDYYLQRLRQWGIKTGTSASHLRALACGIRWEVAEQLHTFDLRGDKEECIAAEIGLSQFTKHNLGLQVIQSDPRPFTYFSHVEWALDGVSKRSNSKRD